MSLRALQTPVLTGPPETLPPERAFWSWEWAEGKGQRPRSEIRALPAWGRPQQGVREGRLPSLVAEDPLSLCLALAIALVPLPTLFWGWGTVWAAQTGRLPLPSPGESVPCSLGWVPG